MSRRDWLKKMFPKGIGLGDIVRLYYNYRDPSMYYHEEYSLRAAELKLLMNYMHRLSKSPTFPEKYDRSFKM